MTHFKPAHTPFYPNTDTVADKFVIAKDINNGATTMYVQYSIESFPVSLSFFPSVLHGKSLSVMWSGGVPQSHLFTALYLC